jgi:hypothetical protein
MHLRVHLAQPAAAVALLLRLVVLCERQQQQRLPQRLV